MASAAVRFVHRGKGGGGGLTSRSASACCSCCWSWRLSASWAACSCASFSATAAATASCACGRANKNNERGHLKVQMTAWACLSHRKSSRAARMPGVLVATAAAYLHPLLGLCQSSGSRLLSLGRRLCSSVLQLLRYGGKRRAGWQPDAPAATAGTLHRRAQMRSTAACRSKRYCEVHSMPSGDPHLQTRLQRGDVRVLGGGCSLQLPAGQKAAQDLSPRARQESTDRRCRQTRMQT